MAKHIKLKSSNCVKRMFDSFLQLLAEGRSMKEVAFILDVTPRTVAFHKYTMMEHLRLRTSAELIQFAIKSSIVAA